MQILLALLLAAAPGEMTSLRIGADFPLTADPASETWAAVPPTIAHLDRYGKPVPGHRTEIRSRWSPTHLHMLFTCPYEQLHLKPDPDTRSETPRLWEWDVAEVFIGADFDNIRRYREFQVSPQGEWIDLEIDRSATPPVTNWEWNSGFEVKSRIDDAAKVWYGEMRIPFAALGVERPAPGQRFRINVYRIQGGGPDRKYITWQPVHSPSYHTPERFGTLRLE
ncbi:MAG: carbohydrate-binding family 9-like protein [Bryobacteraceae bacterium]